MICFQLGLKVFSFIFLCENFTDFSVFPLSTFWRYKIFSTIYAINVFCQHLKEESIMAFVCHNYTCEHPQATLSYL